MLRGMRDGGWGMGDGGVRLSFNRLSGYLDKAFKEAFERKRVDKRRL